MYKFLTDFKKITRITTTEATTT